MTDDETAATKKYDKILKTDEAVFTFRMNPILLYDKDYDKNILVITPFVEEFLESIFDFAEGIVAAGGIVKNDKGELLLIHRRGYWDMAKGKVEKGEKIIAAAKREVEEETGVRVDRVEEDFVKTYHCYVQKGRNLIKETYWYYMFSNDKSTLIPQIEEDIIEVKWASKEEILRLEKEFYPLIFGLLRTVLAINS